MVFENPVINLSHDLSHDNARLGTFQANTQVCVFCEPKVSKASVRTLPLQPVVSTYCALKIDAKTTEQIFSERQNDFFSGLSCSDKRLCQLATVVVHCVVTCMTAVSEVQHHSSFLLFDWVNHLNL